MSRLVVYPYAMNSISSRELSMSLDSFRVYPDRNYRPQPGDIIINWGMSRIPLWFNYMNGAQIVNHPDAVRKSINKIGAFEIMANAQVSIPEWTCAKSTAKRWAEQGAKVFCRTLVSSHAGRGIVVAASAQEVVDAPLYTQDVGERREFRVHVFKNEVMDFAEKLKKNGEVNINSDVRNHGNGWAFYRRGITLPEGTASMAVQAVRSLGLDFGAVDVAVSTSTGLATVFEVNTAPAMAETTLRNYTNAFKGLINGSV